MEEKKYVLQEYADEHCGGDRFLAIYELISGEEEGAFDPYVDGLTRAEANFAMTYISLVAERACGGKEQYRNAVKTNNLLAQLEMTEEAVKNAKGNPFRKKLYVQLLKLLGAILLPIAAMLFLSANKETVAWIESILVGLQSMNVAGAIIMANRFRKVKKLVEAQPLMLPEIEKVTYEDCLAYFNKEQDVASAQDTEQSFAEAKKERRKSWLFLPVYLLAAVVGMVVSKGLGVAAGIVSAVALGAFAGWRIYRLLKTARKTKLMVDNLDSNEIKAFEHKQNMGALGMMALLCLYFLLGFIGCILSVGLAFA